MLARLPLEAPERFEVLEWITRVSVAEALPDELGVQERAVLEKHVRERTAVFVGALPVILEPNPLPFNDPLRELRRLPAEVLDGLLRVLGLRSVDANQANAFSVIDLNRVAVDDARDGAPAPLLWRAFDAGWDGSHRSNERQDQRETGT
jgi:hypothetical protein